MSKQDRNNIIGSQEENCGSKKDSHSVIIECPRLLFSKLYLILPYRQRHLSLICLGCRKHKINN
ncbi:hypothetical protein LX69_02593 [Breznakibacter xylanolyticus]|uniref:Uncharacterized protein n=1 Tax=Breznakibacter xylanolyticus TaxID=990 RepID=A0A2W7N0G4_9BACT|nr:hypothetical protein LX69_02593 [Breznakibacter xylanolyticus]